MGGVGVVGQPPRPPDPITGAASCKAGERPVVHHKELYVPAYVASAQRGDILLTKGGNGVPRAIFDALDQTYNHTMMVSAYDDGSGHTLITHNTAISPGLNSLEFSSQFGVRFKPDHLRRMVPGNAIRDRASTLVHGKDIRCLDKSDTDASGQKIPRTMSDCINARPINLWAANNVLLRPNSAILAQGGAIAQAEAIPANSYLYAFGAYSDHLGLYNATGAEATWGTGSMCSGFAAEAVNDAFANNPQTQLDVSPVPYSNMLRFNAALGLHNRIYSDFMDLLDPLRSGPWWAQVLAWLLTPTASSVATDLTNQIVNCFASGGSCDDKSPWTPINPVTYVQSTSPQPGGLYPVAPNSLGTGLTLSSDDLLDDAVNNSWAQVIPTTVGGDYYYNRFDYLECCKVDPITNDVTNNCYRPDLVAGTSPIAPVEEVLFNSVIGTGDDPFDGAFIEDGDEYCYTTKRGSVCTSLPPRKASNDPTLTPSSPDETPRPVSDTTVHNAASPATTPQEVAQ